VFRQAETALPEPSLVRRYLVPALAAARAAPVLFLGSASVRSRPRIPFLARSCVHPHAPVPVLSVPESMASRASVALRARRHVRPVRVRMPVAQALGAQSDLRELASALLAAPSPPSAPLRARAFRWRGRRLSGWRRGRRDRHDPRARSWSGVRPFGLGRRRSVWHYRRFGRRRCNVGFRRGHCRRCVTRRRWVTLPLRCAREWTADAGPRARSQAAQSGAAVVGQRARGRTAASGDGLVVASALVVVALL
jgi:hypothetical protein